MSGTAEVVTWQVGYAGIRVGEASLPGPPPPGTAGRARVPEHGIGPFGIVRATGEAAMLSLSTAGRSRSGTWRWQVGARPRWQGAPRPGPRRAFEAWLDAYGELLTSSSRNRLREQLAAVPENLDPDTRAASSPPPSRRRPAVRAS